MSNPEVTTIAIIAAIDFGGNFERACLQLNSPHYRPQMLSKSQFNRRLHVLFELLLIIIPRAAIPHS
jgi:hypothetical protein